MSSSSASWQDRLDALCQRFKMEAPLFQIVSDRRGSRTAWSSTVTVYGQTFDARYWYSGLDNAKEDAAELGYKWLKSVIRS